jgi:hypothetical protein
MVSWWLNGWFWPVRGYPAGAAGGVWWSCSRQDECAGEGLHDVARIMASLMSSPIWTFWWD